MAPHLLADAIDWVPFAGFEGLYYNVLAVDENDSTVCSSTFTVGLVAVVARKSASWPTVGLPIFVHHIKKLVFALND